MNTTDQSKQSRYVIVGAGAAGAAAGKCFAAAGLAEQTILLEQHSEPGGSAGYFSRGQPKRTFDAGATQLIECGIGQIQHTLYSFHPSRNQAAAEKIFEKIPSITQHWPDSGKKIILHCDGTVAWKGANPPSSSDFEDIRRLEDFLSVCFLEAEWMWNLLGEYPRFPLQSWTDVRRAAAVFLKIPLRKKLLVPVLLLLNCRQVMKRYGIHRGSLAYDVIRGLLVDTTQSSPEKSPWLAAAMGISILRRGIFRCRKGMRSYFRPMLSSYEESGGSYLPNQRVNRVESTHTGWRVTYENSRTGEISALETDRPLLLNLTLWDIVENLVPPSDPLRTTPIFRRWVQTARREFGWGAFAVYGLIEDNPWWSGEPHYHQIFPSVGEPAELQSSLYVSIPARDDPAQPKGYRVLTATLHVQPQSISEDTRADWSRCLVARIEQTLGSPLSCVETARPETFSRYTGRHRGQVGGFPLRRGNFLFFSNPSVAHHPSQKNCPLIVMGDTVFPGQGVVACSVSGVIAFERATNLTFRTYLTRNCPASSADGTTTT